MKLKRKRDWVGRHVRLLRETRTKGGAVFEAGEVMLVTRNFGGLQLEAVIKCKYCARRHLHRVVKIPEAAVSLLPADYKPEVEA